MFFKVALRSAWHHKRLLGATLIASWLITGFCSFLPLSHRTFSEVVAIRILGDARPEMSAITLDNPRPFAADTLSIVDRELGGLMATRIAFSRAVGDASFPHRGKICGYDYARGELLTSRSRPSVTPGDHCYAIYSFSTLLDLFRLVEGRWPEALQSEPPTLPLRMGEPQVEAVVSVASAQAAGYEIGDRLVLGNDPEQAFVVEIVGLIEPTLPAEDVFWHGHMIVKSPEWTPYSLLEVRLDVGLIVSGEAFDQWILPRFERTVHYHWWLRADTDAIDSHQLKTLSGSLDRVQRDLRGSHPQLELVSGLKSLAERYSADTSHLERLIWSLAGPVLVLMIGQFVLITRLALEEAHNEQAMFASLGASVGQRVALRAPMIGLAVATSIVMGPLLARAAMAMVYQAGPFVTAPEVQALPLVDALAGACAGASGLCVLFAGVAWYEARFPSVYSKLGKPGRPPWQRYFVDLLLITAGVALVTRLFLSATGDLRQSIAAFWSSSIVLSAGTKAGELARGGGLVDPFSMLGPVLLLAGLTLLWLRIYPAILPLAASVRPRQRVGVMRAVVWRARRRLAHYTPLLVMLMATLALGVASLALGSTYNKRARTVAYRETGADVRLEYERVSTGWETLPGVSEAAEVIRLAASGQTVLIGIDPDGSFAGLQEAAELLAGHPSVLPGRELPADAVTAQLQILAPDESQNTTTVRLDVLLLSASGETFTIEMGAAEPGGAGQFITYSAALPGQPPPWRLIGFRLRSEREGTTMFSHRIYVDDLAVVNAQGAETVLEDFEQEASSEQWAGALSQANAVAVATWSHEQAASSTASLRVDYRIRHAAVRELQPLLMVDQVPIPQFPVVVSEAFADLQKRQSGTGRALRVGDRGYVRLELAMGPFRMAYYVAGIVKEFPTVESTSPLIVAPLNDLLTALNEQRGTGPYYGANQVWVVLDSAEPSAAFGQSAPGLPNVVNVKYAWDRYVELEHEPAANLVVGILFAAFCTGWALVTLLSALYVLSIRPQRVRRLHTFRRLGLDTRRMLRLNALEQMIIFLPTLAFGILASLLVVHLLLPFLMPIEGNGIYLSRESLILALLMSLASILPIVSLQFTEARF